MKKIKHLKLFPNINNIKDLSYKANIVMNKAVENFNIIEYGNLLAFNCLKIFINGKNNKIKIGNNTAINNSCIYIKGNNNEIELGSNCNLKEINIICRNDNNKIKIGNNVSTAGKFWGFVDLHVMDETEISIGNECMISGNIIIRSDDGHPIYNDNNTIINKSANIIIGNHVWIAQDVKILKGVKIADNSIIGIGSVVTKSFDKKSCVLAGNPAKPISKYDNFRWTRKKS